MTRFLFILYFLSITWVFAESSTDLKQLPVVAQNALHNVLRDQPVKSIKPLTGGFSGAQLYKVDTVQHSYVLRLLDLQTPFADRDREIKSLKIASHEDIAPKVYYANPKDGVILMDYIQHTPLTDKDRSPPLLLPRLAHLLKKLHEGPAFPPIISRIKAIQHIAAQLEKKGLQLPSLANEALAHLQEIEAPLQKTTLSAPCHNDLNPNNILFSGNEIKVIDWEAAGMGDPYFDLATVSLFFIFDAGDEELFLTSYLGAHPTLAQKNLLYVMKQVSLCFYGVALLRASFAQQAPPLSSSEIEALPGFSDFLIAIGSGQEKIDSPLYTQRFGLTAFKQALKNMKSKEFMEALKSL